MSRNIRKIGVLVLTLWVAGLLAACGNSTGQSQGNIPTATRQPQSIPTAVPTPAPTTTPEIVRVVGKLGETLTSPDGCVVTLVRVEKSPTFSKLATSRPSYTLLAVEVTVMSRADKKFAINSRDMVIKDSDKLPYYPFVYGKNPLLFDQKSELAFGDKISGWVTFEVPEMADNLVFEYQTPLAKNLFSVKL